jgi:cation diffusion facilitator CzcD-associated flavoprotein CzcO
VGGVWLYDEQTEDEDPLGLSSNRKRVHSSMYASLRTNLPREIMAYWDLPFTPAAMEAVAAGARSPLAADTLVTQDTSASREPMHLPCASVDSRRYCTHEEVLRYLNAYAVFHGLAPLIRFHTRVVEVSQELNNNSSNTDSGAGSTSATDGVGRAPWRVITVHGDSQTPVVGMHTPDNSHHQQLEGEEQQTTQPVSDTHSQQHQEQAMMDQRGTVERFDAVVVCNGHYSEPNLPDVVGARDCPAAQLHSHNYRRPDAYKGKVVLVVGAANSGEDISREVAQVCVGGRVWEVRPCAGLGYVVLLQPELPYLLQSL